MQMTCIFFLTFRVVIGTGSKERKETLDPEAHLVPRALPKKDRQVILDSPVCQEEMDTRCVCQEEIKELVCLCKTEFLRLGTDHHWSFSLSHHREARVIKESQ